MRKCRSASLFAPSDSRRWALCLILLVAPLCFIHCQPPGPSGPGPAVSIWPGSGTITPGTAISLTSAPGAQIYYTLDETPPSATHGYLYDGSFALWGASIVRFIAIDPEGRPGPLGQAQFQLDVYAPRTSIAPPGGNQAGPIQVSFSTSSDASVFYTQNGTTPSAQSQRYKAPFVVAGDTTIRFLAIDAAGNREQVQQTSYNFAPQLQVEPPSGLYPQEPLTITTKSNEVALIQYRSLVPLGPWQQLLKPLVIAEDVRLQITSTDLTGLSTSLIRDYAFARPLTQKTETTPLRNVLASALVDLEGLGQARLLVATQGALYSVARGAGGKGWKAPVELASLPFTTRWIRCWDLDGDGLSDVLLGDSKGGLHLFRAITAELLQPDATLVAPWPPAREDLVMVVPLDQDANGQLDILLLDARKGQSRILRRTSQGYLLNAPLEPAIEAGAVGALAGDFNKDGDPDLLLLPGGARVPYFLINQKDDKGVRTFTKRSLVEPLARHVGVKWLHAARADFDLDGDLDLVLIGEGPAPAGDSSPSPPGFSVLHVVLVRFHGGATWQREDALLLPTQGVRGVLLCDLDADGFDDLVLLSSVGGTIQVIKNVQGRRLMRQTPGADPQATWPNALTASVAETDESGNLSLWLLQSRGALQQLVHLREVPLFLRVVLLGIQGNRNSIGAWVTSQTKDSRRVHEIGIRHTGADQSAFYFPVHFAEKKQIGALTLRWPDGVKREIPAPTPNETMILSPP